MFEKEAEKHADGIYHYKINVSDYGEDGIINYRYSDVKEAYQKGAEFGYNKANEWHKVTEKLPEHENLVCNQDGEPCWYDSETDQWLDVEGTRTKTIEWCDMPTKESE